MTLQDRLNSLTLAYIKAFQKHIGIEYDHESGGVHFFGDYCLTFEGMAEIINYKIPKQTFFDWWQLTTTYSYKINLKTYWRRERDHKYNMAGFGYDKKDFWLYLMSEQLKRY